MSDFETEEQRRVTESLIESRPIYARINRPPAYVSDGAGGMHRVGATQVRSPLRCFLTDVEKDETFIVDDIGERITDYHVLIADYQADLKQGDWFVWEGRKYIVLYIHPNRAYQVKASVVTVE